MKSINLKKLLLVVLLTTKCLTDNGLLLERGVIIVNTITMILIIFNLTNSLTSKKSTNILIT